jgi:hypothetical protein
MVAVCQSVSDRLCHLDLALARLSADGRYSGI